VVRRAFHIQLSVVSEGIQYTRFIRRYILSDMLSVSTGRCVQYSPNVVQVSDRYWHRSYHRRQRMDFERPVY